MTGCDVGAYVFELGRTNPEGRYQVRCACTKKSRFADTIRQANDIAEYHDAMRHPLLEVKSYE